MAGMEQLEIHSKSYLVRWVNAKPDHTISWTVQPHKRSINFGLFKHPGHLGGVGHHPSVGGLPNLNLQTSRDSDDKDKDDGAPAVVDKLTSIGLKQVIRLGKCEADKSTQGKYDVPGGEAGNYALVFDNTFSKSVSKTVTIFMLTYPTAWEAQIHFGAQLHHSQAMATAVSMAPPTTGRRSPKLKAGREGKDSLHGTPGVESALSTPLVDSAFLSDQSHSIHTGILQKRRRKRGQGFARRFFCLDFTSSTLSYYHDRNSSALRGAIPLALAAIGANARTREISIDSGAEIWHLKASNKADFDDWKAALETASRNVADATSPGDLVSLRTDMFSPASQPLRADDQDWAKLEAILSRIAGTRDSIRRLSLETLSRPVGPGSSSQEPAGLTPPDTGSEDYFGKTERRSFWKRKPSTPNAQQTTFKRSISAQLAVPAPAASESAHVNGTAASAARPAAGRTHSHREEGMHEHMRALLTDLDTVVQDFSSVITGSKQRKALPRSAVSRMSTHSIDSQEFFDAEDAKSGLLVIPDESEAEDEFKTDVDSDGSSDDDDDGKSYTGRGREFRSGSLSSLLPPKPKTLHPLPHDAVTRRQTIRAPTVMPPSLIGFLRKNVGKDLSTISMPVSANEPLSLLQRAAENLEYSTLLDAAAKAADPEERLLLVTAFVISQLSTTRIKERSIRKPFNPMLGETFELVREDLGFRFVAEKVSHRPVQLACCAEGHDWTYAQSPLPSQKFWGKSSEIITEGKARLVLHSAGERFSWSAPTCFLRNIIAGEKYVEPVGSMAVLNETTGAKAVITFKAKGMFSGRSEEVDAQLYDPDGVELTLGLNGTWTDSLKQKEHGKVGTKVVWNVGATVSKAEKHYGMTTFAAGLNEITDMEQGKLPPTDSRLRPDQRTLEEGDHEKAEDLKNTLEEAQRARRREMEASGEQWGPKWFVKMENDDEVIWKLKTGHESYWDARSKADWTNVVDVLKVD